MSKHTPAPWYIETWTIGQQKEEQTTITCGSDRIAVVSHMYMENEGEHEANARLIAAAPRLLYLLREAAKHIPHNAYVPDLEDEIKVTLAHVDGVQS